MNEVTTTFETTRERDERRRREAEQQRAEAEHAERERRLAELNRQQAAANSANWQVSNAHTEEEAAALRGRELTARLADARQRVESLRRQIEQEVELKAVEIELSDSEHALVLRPLTDAHPDATARLAHFRELARLWPSRKKYLGELLENAEVEVANLESVLTETASLFGRAKRRVAELVGR